jgi:RHS repeat-associated protein
MEEERFARLNHRDSETSLDPTHFRMYASGQGRWLSPDPLMGHPFNPQTFDRYGYALGNPARFTDPTGQDPVYCEFVTINGEFAGGGCDYTGGSSDYLNPYQEYEYNCMVYPAGCGYYNGMPVPNYPAYGGGGYTPTPPPPPPPPQLPSCYSIWWDAFKSAINPFSPGLGSLAEPGASFLSSVYFNQALNYAAEKGLTYPLKSSVFRSLFYLSRDIGGAVPLMQMDAALLQADLAELKAARAGACE